MEGWYYRGLHHRVSTAHNILFETLEFMVENEEVTSRGHVTDRECDLNIR